MFCQVPLCDGCCRLPDDEEGNEFGRSPRAHQAGKADPAESRIPSATRRSRKPHEQKAILGRALSLKQYGKFESL